MLKAEQQRRDADRRPAGSTYASPGALAAALYPRLTVQTPALDLLDQELVDVASGVTDRLMWFMPPQEGKPVIVSAMILMGDGSRRQLADVQVGDTVITHLGRPRTVTAVHEQGLLSVVTIKTHAGRVVTAALDHPFLTPDGWVNAGDLAVGQVLGCVPSPQTTPTASLTPEAARLMGYVIGDGNTTISETGSNAAISCVDETEAEDIRRCAEALGFGVNSKPRRLLLSKGVRPWLRQHKLAGCTSWTKRVPEEIFTQPPEIIAEFVGAYFACDGTVSRRGGARPDARLEFNSVSRDLLADVQHLLLRLGIATTLRPKNTTVNGQPYVSWRLLMRRQDDVARFRALVPIHHSKAEVLADWPLRRTAFDAPFLPDEIVEIVQEDQPRECRCLTVDEDHTFTAEDLVVHNSQRVSRWFPLWMLTRDPDLRIAIASYELGVARRWGRAIRNEIKAHPELKLTVRADTAAAHEWELDGHTGGVYCAGVGGPLTGRPVDLMIIDDPVKGRQEADSETYRKVAKDWWSETVNARLGEHTPVVLIMTRWHQDDLAGWLQTEYPEDWRVINVPALADHKPSKGETDPLGREPGEWLLSARGRTREGWEKRRKNFGERGFTALCQGRPSPAEGAMFRRGWWRYYKAPQWFPQRDGSMKPGEFDQVLQSWDMTFKDTKGTDYVTGQVWGRRGADAYLLDQVRDRMDFPTTCKEVAALTAKWPSAQAKLVEDKANGPAVIAQLRNAVPGLIPITPKDSKEARAAAVSPFAESGNVYLPDPGLAPWVAGFVEECAAFPNGTHDDQVDCMSQALDRLMISASTSRSFLEALSGRR